MQPADNGLLHATLKNGPIKDYWQLDIESLRGTGGHAHALHNLTSVTSMAPGFSDALAAAKDTREQPVSTEAQIAFKAATVAKMREQEDENNLPHGTPSWHPARAHHTVDAVDDEAGQPARRARRRLLMSTDCPQHRFLLVRGVCWSSRGVCYGAWGDGVCPLCTK